MLQVKIRNKNTQVQQIKVKKPIVDIKHVQQGDNNELLVVLTEDELQTYKLA